MVNLKNWFLNLTRIGQVSAISAIALGGIFVASATTPPTTPSADTPPISTPVENDPVITTKTISENQSIAFEKQTIEDASLDKGTVNIKVAGIDGIKTITHTITLTDGVETDRKTAEAVTKEPVKEVTVIGTYVKPAPSCDTNYTGCVPIVSYDLDCGDIGFSVTVLGYDKHRFDGDRDGYGCESY